MANGIETLDVYRRSITLGTQLYQQVGNGTPHGNSIAEKIRQTALTMVLNLAAGLGYWEKEVKTGHFAASKRAIMEISPLLELMVALGELKKDAAGHLATELQDLAKMVNGLLRQAKRREQAGEVAAGATEAREGAPL